jgi:hypothetical protein
MLQVTCTLPVKRMLRPDDKGEKHEKFLSATVRTAQQFWWPTMSVRAPSVPAGGWRYRYGARRIYLERTKVA